MDTLNIIFFVLSGVLLRLFVPLAVTALVVFMLHKLDARWQAEAEQELKMLAKDEMPCCKEQRVSVDQLALRLASGERPCWQTHRSSNGHLREDCLDCEVFRDAPVPTVHIHTHAHV